MEQPKIEIVAIGNEILAGITANTNAAEIGQALFKNGLVVHRHSVLPDDARSLELGLQEAMQRSRYVITTGGLGPTCDDLSRTIAAKLFQKEMKFRPELAAQLEQRYGKGIPTLQDQSMQPETALLMDNPNGTAPGLILTSPQSTLLMMPGVPREMRPMFENHLIPYLLEHITHRVSREMIYLCDLPEAAVDPLLRNLEQTYPQITFGIYPAQGFLTVTLTAQAEDQELLSSVKKILQKEFEASLFESPHGKIDEAVHLRLIERGESLSIAESCTGGALAAKLTQYSGCSKYFLGGVVGYSNALKEKVLEMDPQLLQKYGAVSEEAVSAMAQSVQDVSGSDWSLAVTGIAGPTGGTPEKPVGTVWCAILPKGQEPMTWKLELKGSRPIIIERSINSIFSHLYKMLN